MATRKLDFPVFDADNHLYETTDALTKYLPRGNKAQSTMWTFMVARRLLSVVASSSTVTRPRAGGTYSIWANSETGRQSKRPLCATTTMCVRTMVGA